MKISDVRVRIVKTDKSKIKASASITIDECFVVHDIKVIEGKDIVHPLNTETREMIRDIVLKAFDEAKENAASEE